MERSTFMEVSKWKGPVAVIAVIVILVTVVCWVILTRLEIERQRVIVDEVAYLADVCKSIKGCGLISIQGRALVWDMTLKSRSGAYGKLPRDLRASSSDSQITVFMVVGKRNDLVGTYSISGQPGYREYIDICVAYWPEKKPVGMCSVVSKEPPPTRPVQQQPEYGEPNEPIANWIAGLPRNTK